jgi:hypothetical protein
MSKAKVGKMVVTKDLAGVLSREKASTDLRGREIDAGTIPFRLKHVPELKDEGLYGNRYPDPPRTIYSTG